MLKIAFCDDDENFTASLSHIINKYLSEKNIEYKSFFFNNGFKLIEHLKKDTFCFDVIFLDIEMPAINGKQLAKQLRLISSTFKLIFISSHPNEVFNCFEFDVLDFIPKALVLDNIKKTLDRLLESISPANNIYHFFEVKTNFDKIDSIKILSSDIFYFESISRKVYLNTRKDTYQLHKVALKDIEAKYLKDNFIITHRGYIVNIKYIQEIKEDQVRLDNGVLLPLSRRHKKATELKFINQINETNFGDNI